jgi:hypothetical protein
MTLSLLSLASLAFASSSDEEFSREVSSEQDWAQRFAEADHLRALCKIPAMTQKERMARMLGLPFVCPYTFSLSLGGPCTHAICRAWESEQTGIRYWRWLRFVDQESESEDQADRMFVHRFSVPYSGRIMQNWEWQFVQSGRLYLPE